MKKSLIIKTCSIAFIIVIMIIVILFVISTEPEPSFQFLNGRDESIQVDNYSDSLSVEIDYRYSFRADYNDVCVQADKELLPLGYKKINVQLTPFDMHQYKLNGKSANDFTEVSIVTDRRYKKYPTTPNNKPSIMNIPFYYQADSVVVQIIQSKTKNKYLAKIQHFFNKIRNME